MNRMRQNAVMCVVAMSMSFLTGGAARAAHQISLPVVHQFPTPVGAPEGLAFVNGDLWVWDVAAGSTVDAFYVLDPLDGTVLSTYPVIETGGSSGLAFDGESLWGVCGGSYQEVFAKFDPTDGSMIASYDLPIPSPAGITFDGTNLWMANVDGHDLVSIDPHTLEITSSLTVEPYYSGDLAWDGSTLWLSSLTRDRQNLLYQIDPATGNTLNIYEAPGPGPVGMVVNDDLLYVSDVLDDTIYVVSIPEPGTGLLMLASVCVVTVHRRRKQLPFLATAAPNRTG